MSPLTEAEQEYLLILARQAVEVAARGEQLESLPEPQGSLREARGAFVTLRKRGELRGCIGHVEPFKSLCETVRDCAVAAALYDSRFEPVTSSELPHLRVDISVLSALQDASPDEIELGRHGLLISHKDRRGVLLPQVALDLKWNRDRFLEETCRKAGLRSDAWQHGARIQVFTTQIFAEAHPGAGSQREAEPE
jgi:AmmeMemoRadiSam system protein A